jgi:hypothetical protein
VLLRWLQSVNHVRTIHPTVTYPGIVNSSGEDQVELFSINGNIRHPRNINGVELKPRTPVNLQEGFLTVYYTEEDREQNRYRPIAVIYNSDGREVLQVTYDWASRSTEPPTPVKVSFWQQIKAFFQRPLIGLPRSLNVA